MLPKRVTGLCGKQQRRIGTMVTMAQKAGIYFISKKIFLPFLLIYCFFYFIKGLMPNIAPENSKKDPKKRYQWKKYNKYFDEDTLKTY